MEKGGYFTFLEEDCSEWFVNEMLAIETFLKTSLKKETR